MPRFNLTAIDTLALQFSFFFSSAAYDEGAALNVELSIDNGSFG